MEEKARKTSFDDNKNGQLLLSYYVSNPALSTLPGFISITVNCYNERSHFTGEEMEVQRS